MENSGLYKKRVAKHGKGRLRHRNFLIRAPSKFSEHNLCISYKNGMAAPGNSTRTQHKRHAEGCLKNRRYPARMRQAISLRRPLCLVRPLPQLVCLTFDTGDKAGEYFALKVRGESMLSGRICPWEGLRLAMQLRPPVQKRERLPVRASRARTRCRRGRA